MPSFFSADPFTLNVQYALDLSLITQFSTLLFNGDVTRIEYRGNEYAFRARTDKFQGKLNLPFMNMQCVNWKQEDEYNWYGSPADLNGYIEEAINTRVHLMPIKLIYEATIWTERDDDQKLLANKMLWFRKNHTRLSYPLTLTSPDKTLTGTTNNIAIVDFEGVELGNNFSEKEWLEKNQIRSIQTNFAVQTFMLKTEGGGIYPVDTVIFQFCQDYGGDPDHMTFEDQMQFVVDNLNGTVTEVPYTGP